MKSLSGRHLLLLLLVVLLGWGVGRMMSDAAPDGRAIADVDALRALAADPAAPSSGPADATVTLVVFTDYRCPACRRAAPALEAAVRRDAHVRLVYRDYPIFGAPSARAARVALAAAGQGVYPALHRRLMAERRTLAPAVLREAVIASGGDWARVLHDLRTNAPAIDAQLAATRRYAVALGVIGTPGYVAGTTLVVGALDERGFARLFAQARNGV